MTEQNNTPTPSYQEFKRLVLSSLDDYLKRVALPASTTWGTYPCTLIFNEESDGWELSMHIALSSTGYSEELSDFLTDFENNHFDFIKPMKELLFSHFSETTNSDACSYRVDFDTDHASFTEDNSQWVLQVKITDYLS